MVYLLRVHVYAYLKIVNEISMPKIAFLGVFIAVALCALSAAPAFAQLEWGRCHNVGAGKGSFNDIDCTVPEGTKEFQYNTYAKGVQVPIKASATSSFKLKAGPLKVECKLFTGTGWVENPVGGTGIDLLVANKPGQGLTECKVPGSPGCKVTEPIALEATSVLGLDPVTRQITDKLTPTAGTVFTITVSECEPAGTKEVTGEIEGSVGMGEVGFPSSPLEGTKLKSGSETAEFVGTMGIETESGEPVDALSCPSM